MRPKQWYKNLLVFFGILFSMNIFHIMLWLNVILAFMIFCLLSGCVYIINDVFDKKKDLLHSIKSKRPIASGKLNEKTALAMALLLLFCVMGASTFLGTKFSLIVFLYFCLTFAYNMALKKLYLVDVFSISLGMVLRAIAGCIAIGVIISPWLILCTFLMALYLALSKRRHELILLDAGAENHRAILRCYSVKSLDTYLIVIMSSLIVCYCLYTFFSGHIYMMLTIPFSLYGIFRFTDHIYNKSMGSEAEIIFRDLGIVIDLILWVFVVVFVLLGIPETLVAIIG